MGTKVISDRADVKMASLEFIKNFQSRVTDPRIGTMSDAEIKDLIASRYAQNSSRSLFTR